VKQGDLFPQLLAKGLDRTIRDANPWWRGERPFLPSQWRRWAFDYLKRDLAKPLAPVTVLRGPRQVGKTTLLVQLIDEMIADGIDPKRIFRVQFDDIPELRKIDQPILDLVAWFADNILGKSLNQAAHDGKKAIIVFDEVQNLPDWATQLKHLVDLQPCQVIVTGSSALRIEAGRDSLAGRVSTLEMGPLLLREIGEFRGQGSIAPYLPVNGTGPLKRKEFWKDLRSFGEKHVVIRRSAFDAYSERGAYPVAQQHGDYPWERIADQLVETVVRRAIQHDLRMGPRGAKRDENLLEEMFRLACRYIGQSPKQALYLDEVHRTLGANIGPQRILTYLKFLDGTMLIRLIHPLELRLKKKKGAAKLVLCDHALRAAWLQEVVPIAPIALEAQPHLTDLAGRIAESAAGYFLSSIVNLDVAHFPERGAEPEVDFVATVGEQRIPIEIKYRRRIEHSDTAGLRSFIEKAHYNAPFGILLTLGDEAASDDPRIVSMPLSTFLMMR
jgi:predicted AAA+ superfamily ATPase